MQTAAAYVHGLGLQAMPATSLLRNFIESELPKINTAIETGKANVEMLVTRARPLLAAFRGDPAIACERINRDGARYLLQLFGFVISSAERHFQANGELPGVGKATLGLADEMLSMLGQIGGHPPRDSDTTYWYLNRDCQLSFTGDPQEAHFNRVVNLQRTIQSAACNFLRPICEGTVDISSIEAVRAMLQAARRLEDLIEGYRSFIEPINGGYRFSPDFFMRRMRTYLVEYPIAGRGWSGPNAANLTANMSLDYLTGLTSPWYADVVRSRWRYLVDEDQRQLRIDISTPSLADRALQTIRLDSRAAERISTDQLAQQIASQSADLQTMLRAFASVVRPVTHATGIHFRLIHEYLIRNATKLSRSEYESLPVKPNKGTGQMAHGQTQKIMDMRRKHPIVSKLLAAIHAVNNADYKEGETSCPRNTKWSPR